MADTPMWFPLLGTPFAIRWSLLDERRAQINHGQSLKRLAERGGLGVSEASAVIGNRQWVSQRERDAFAELLDATPPAGAGEAVAWEMRQRTARDAPHDWTPWTRCEKWEHDSIVQNRLAYTEARTLYAAPTPLPEAVLRELSAGWRNSVGPRRSGDDFDEYEPSDRVNEAVHDCADELDRALTGGDKQGDSV
jgi:hypothetical protein